MALITTKAKKIVQQNINNIAGDLAALETDQDDFADLLGYIHQELGDVIQMVVGSKPIALIQ